MLRRNWRKVVLATLVPEPVRLYKLYYIFVPYVLTSKTTRVLGLSRGLLLRCGMMLGAAASLIAAPILGSPCGGLGRTEASCMISSLVIVFFPVSRTYPPLRSSAARDLAGWRSRLCSQSPVVRLVRVPRRRRPSWGTVPDFLEQL